MISEMVVCLINNLMQEKLLKRKMQNVIAEALLAKNGPLTISEHGAIVSQVKQEIAQARAELLQISGDAFASKSMSPLHLFITKLVFFPIP